MADIQRYRRQSRRYQLGSSSRLHVIARRHAGQGVAEATHFIALSDEIFGQGAWKNAEVTCLEQLVHYLFARCVGDFSEARELPSRSLAAALGEVVGNRAYGTKQL